MSKWQPIETYDALKKAPDFAVFYVQAKASSRHSHAGDGLKAMIATERRFGNRKVTHWMPLPEPQQALQDKDDE